MSIFHLTRWFDILVVVVGLTTIALVGTIVLTGAVANIALSVWENNKNIHKRTKNKNE